MKKCTKCGKRGEFNKEKRNKDGLKSWCKECTKKAKRIWRSQNADYSNKKKREWYLENREHAISYAKSRSLEWRYGITAIDYAEILIEQKGLCKICGQPRTEKFALSVDHNHVTGRVRGLLCGKCNFVLGNANDDPELLRKAALYLEEA